MKFPKKCVFHINRKADGKFRGIPFCSDCLKNVKRRRGNKNNKVTVVYSEKLIGQLNSYFKIYENYPIKLK